MLKAPRSASGKLSDSSVVTIDPSALSMHCFVNEFGFAVAQFPACGAHDISPATAADRIVCTLQPPRLNHTPRLFQRVAWQGKSRQFRLRDYLSLQPTRRATDTHH